MTRIHFSAVAVAAMLASSPAWAQTEIQWWHAMGGNLGEAVNALADGFNKSQSEYKVTPVYKGSYTETLTAAIAAFRAKQAPHIVQVFEVGTANMMAAKGAVYPVFQLMADAKESFDPKAYIGPVYGYYSTVDGKLLSMPFNSSTPVLYWNKAAFKKAGLDPEKPPKTWPEMGEAGKKLLASGMKCGFSTGWPSWIQIENFGAWHNVPMPYFIPRLLSTTAGGLWFGLKKRRVQHDLWGILKGYGASVRDWRNRKPVRRETYKLNRRIRTERPLALAEIEKNLPPMK